MDSVTSSTSNARGRDEHHSDSCETTSSVGYERGWGYSYKCFHSECTKEERGWQEFKQRVIAQNPDVPAYGNALPQLPSECSHADVARYFMEHEPAAKNHIHALRPRTACRFCRHHVGPSAMPAIACFSVMLANAVTIFAGTCRSQTTRNATIGPS